MPRPQPVKNETRSGLDRSEAPRGSPASRQEPTGRSLSSSSIQSDFGRRGGEPTAFSDLYDSYLRPDTPQVEWWIATCGATVVQATHRRCSEKLYEPSAVPQAGYRREGHRTATRSDPIHPGAGIVEDPSFCRVGKDGAAITTESFDQLESLGS